MTSQEPLLREGLSGQYSYQNQTNRSSLDMSHSYSVNTIPSIHDYIISEDLLAGQRLDGRMSAVRRFFCLFVTFDFLFISLMWLICVMLNGQNIVNAFIEQILHYNIHESLFDIVLVAFMRFLLLILFYAILYINHWIVISLSTGLSSAFLIGKVFAFDWTKTSQPVFEVLLVLASFIVSWGEAWFLDFRVIPQEVHANRYLISATESERAPLIRRFIQGVPSMYAESTTFYSPRSSLQGSLLHEEEPENAVIPPEQLTPDQETHYKHLGARTLQSAWDLYQKTDWKLRRQQNESRVFDRKDPQAGTIFKLETQIDASPRYILDELYFRVANLPKWNPTVKESQKVQAIDEFTDITYQVSENGAGGIVSSRDFVNLRQWARIENAYVLCCVKCDYPQLPPNNKYVRGENGVGGYILECIDGENDKCRFTWIINPHLKVRVPKTILDRQIWSMMMGFAQNLKTHINSLTGETK
uniref:START domain-containing protein n=1 Tax=Dendroctonus ponderosae TaxID=77166 RepID=A0AAR5QD71_DENPD